MTVTIAGGKILKANDYSIPFCELLHLSDKKEQLPTELELPIGLNLTFGGSVSGSYHKSNLMDDGFTLMTDLTGYEKSLRIYCTSNDPNQPLRYLGARYISHPVMDWKYSF